VIQDHYLYKKDLVFQLAKYLDEFSDVDLVMFKDHFERGFILRTERLQPRTYDIFEAASKKKNGLQDIFQTVFQKFNHKMLVINSK